MRRTHLLVLISGLAAGCGPVPPAPPSTTPAPTVSPAVTPPPVPKDEPEPLVGKEPDKPVNVWAEAKVIMEKAKTTTEQATAERMKKLDIQQMSLARVCLRADIDKPVEKGTTAGELLWKMGFREHVTAACVSALSDPDFSRIVSDYKPRPKLTADELVGMAVRYSMTNFALRKGTLDWIKKGIDLRTAPDQKRLVEYWVGE